MSPTPQDKPPGKPRSRKAAPRSKKRDQAQKPDREDQGQIGEVMVSAIPAEVVENVDVVLAAGETSAIDDAPLPQEPEFASGVASPVHEAPPELEAEGVPDAAPVVRETAPELEAGSALRTASEADERPLDHAASQLTDRAPPASIDPAGSKTIGDDYKNYVNGSVRRAGFLFEKLMAARSFGQAMEVQAEFAKQPCANVLEGAEIAFKLYGDFTRRLLTTWQRNAPGKAVQD